MHLVNLFVLFCENENRIELEEQELIEDWSEAGLSCKDRSQITL